MQDIDTVPAVGTTGVHAHEPGVTTESQFVGTPGATGELETVPTSVGTKINPLGSTCEITRRFRNFVHFWRENPRIARFALQTEARSLLPGHRVRNCIRARVDNRRPVDVYHVPHLLSAHYGNLQTCGSVWVCPVCASKIASRRRTDDLTPGVENWTGQGNMVFLATFTMQHLAGDTCSEVLEAITNAHSEFWRFRAGRRIKQVYGIAGKVRSLEVTYGQNGWHWHYHVLLFVRDKLSLSQVEDMHQEMAEHWQYVVSRSGKFADSVHGFDLRHSDRQVVDYVSKYGSEGEGKIDTWTEAHELAMSTVKRSARGGLTPFQLLGLSLAGEKRASQLFLEYVEAVKGKKQLHWSKGLRKAVGLLDEKTDEEIATEQEEHAYLLAQLDREHWRLIVENAARGELLKVASLGDQEALREFLSDFGINAYYPEV